MLMGTFEFRAVKTGTIGTTDGYIIDVTTILPNLLAIPDKSYVTTFLTSTQSVTIKAYESNGIVNSKHITSRYRIVVCI